MILDAKTSYNNNILCFWLCVCELSISLSDLIEQLYTNTNNVNLSILLQFTFMGTPIARHKSICSDFFLKHTLLCYT